MNQQTLNVLMIEDNPGDIRLVQALLEESGPGMFDLTGKECLKDGIEHLSSSHVDVILLDLNLSDSKGLDTFRQTHAFAPDIPVVVYSGMHDEDMAMEAVKEGAQDYLVKGHPEESGIGRTLRYAVERKAAEKALRESEEKYRLLVSNLEYILTVHDLEGTLIFMNEAGTRNFGLEPADVAGRPLGDFFPDLVDLFLERARQVANSGQGMETEDDVVLPQGKGWFRSNMQPIKNPEGGVVAVQTISYDITERRQAQEALRESEEQFREVVERASDFIIIIQDENIQYANPQALEAFGYSLEEVIGTSLLNYAHPDEQEKLIDNYRRRLAGENTPNLYESALIHKDGQRVDVEISGGLINFKGRPANLVVVRDITERKAAEQALRESEEKYRDLVNNIAEAIFVAEPDGTVTFISPAIEPVLGYEVWEITGHNFAEFIYADDLPQAAKSHDRVIAGESTVGEFRAITKSGQIRWLQASTRPIKHEGKVTSAYGVLMDITETRQITEELKRSEEKFRVLAEQSIVGIALVNEGGMIYANDSIRELMDYPPGAEPEQSIDTLVRYIHPDDRDWVMGMFSQRLEGKLDLPSQYELRIVTAAGEDKWISVNVGRIDLDEKPAFVTITLDITQRKLAEEKLKASEEQLQAMMESARDGIVMVDLQGHVLVINQAMAEMTGYSKEELIGEDVLQFVMPQDRTVVRDGLDTITGEDALLPLTSYKLIAKDGRILDIEISNGLIHDQSGKTVGLVCIIRDVTERKQWEEALRQSEQRYRDLIENANEAILVAQDGLLKYVNPKALEMTGYSYEELTTRPFLEFIYEGDRETVATNNLKRLAGEPVPETYMFRIVNKLRSMRWLEINAVVIEWEDSPATLNFLADVTSRKLAEDALKASEDKYRFVTEQIQDMIAMTDINGVYLYANEAHQKIMGYNPTKMVSVNATEYVHPDDMPALVELFATLPLKTSTAEVRFRHQDGSWRWCEARFSIMTFMNTDGIEELRVLVVSNDISERKRLTEEKEELLDHIEAAYQELQETHEQLKASQSQLLHSEKLAAVGQLVAGVAHELNNPLMAISGYATLLGLDPTEKETREYQERLNEEASRAVAIVDNLLSFARKQEHQSQLLSINEVIESVVKLREYELSLDNVTLIKKLASDLPPVNADFQQLQQVFLNLVINSEQAIKQSGDGGSIDIRTWQERGMVHAAVSDTGPGIPEDIRSKVFDPFFTTKEVGEGTGLGLSICYGIIQEHQGTINAVDTSGNGAEFLIKLPSAEGGKDAV